MVFDVDCGSDVGGERAGCEFGGGADVDEVFLSGRRRHSSGRGCLVRRERCAVVVAVGGVARTQRGAAGVGSVEI